MKKITIIILTLAALAVIAGLIFTKKPVDDYRFFSGIFDKPVVQGELVSNEAMSAVVEDKSISINVHPNKIDNPVAIEKIIKRYFSNGRSEIIKAVNDSCDAVRLSNYTDGAETYRHTSETGNSIYIRTWSNYGGTVYILITRGV